MNIVKNVVAFSMFVCQYSQTSVKHSVNAPKGHLGSYLPCNTAFKNNIGEATLKYVVINEQEVLISV